MRCSSCRADLFVRDVFKQKKVPGADSHLVLYYRCGVCGYQDSVVIDKQTWSSFEPASNQPSSQSASNNNLVIRLAQLDLERVETLEDLELYWRAQKTPPLREGVFCDCSDCIKRRGGPSWGTDTLTPT